MLTQHLSDEDLRATIQRAREITEQSRELTAPEAGYEAYLQAAEEMGVPREATLQALRERLLIPSQAVAEGELVFAPSVDGFWYAATLKELGEQTARVAFVHGGEHTCALSDLRPLSLIPGKKVEGDLKGWGWWGVTVERYDPEKQRVHVLHDDWAGGKETLSLRKIRLSPKHALPRKAEKAPPEAVRALLLRWSLLAGGIGAAAGFLLAKLLPFV